MTGEPGDPTKDPDDWFGAGRGREGADFDGPDQPSQERPVEDWLVAPEGPRAPHALAALWERLSPGQRFAVVTALAAIVLLIILAAAGAFSSGPSQPQVVQPAPVTTFASTTPTVPETTTTAATTTTGTTTSAGTTLRPGDHGPAVVKLQQQLIALGYGIGKADGDYGTVTTNAVIAFQKSNGIAADGIAGPATRKALAAAAAGH